MADPHVAGVAALLVGFAAAPALALDDRPAPDSKWAAEGSQIYQQYCASCHGANGEGAPNWQRQNARGELPAPPHGPEGHTWKHSDAMLYRIISEGWRDPWNETERLTMPAFGDVLSPHQIKAVITYLKTLWTPEQRQFQEQESEDAPFPGD